jgi:hypothetical protein
MDLSHHTSAFRLQSIARAATKSQAYIEQLAFQVK